MHPCVTSVEDLRVRALALCGATDVKSIGRQLWVPGTCPVGEI